MYIECIMYLVTGNPGSAPSPASQSADEQAYLEKLKHLSKYVEPLMRMIKKTEQQDGRNQFSMSHISTIFT